MRGESGRLITDTVRIVTRMRVGLDVTPTLSGRTGIGRYVLQLHAGLRVRADTTVRSFALGRGDASAVTARRLPVPLRVVHTAWRHGVSIPVTMLTGRVDVLHATDLVAPPSRTPVVQTVHDLLALQHPEFFSARTIQIVRDAAAALSRVRTIITTCSATADSISDMTGFPRDRVCVVHVGHRPPSLQQPPSLIDEPYVLAVGVVQARKAFEVLVEAVARLGTDGPLVVIAGPLGADAADIIDRFEVVGMGGRVRILEYVSDDDLEALYRHALALGHPSVAEGFGSPALEALGLGVPLVAADIPSVREMAAGCARLVPPRDVDATADALRRVWEEPQETARLVQAGLARAQDFTWPRMIEETVDTYRRAIG